MTREEAAVELENWAVITSYDYPILPELLRISAAMLCEPQDERARIGRELRARLAGWCYEPRVQQAITEVCGKEEP